MAISFPASPSGGDRFVTSGTTYMYDGEKWTGITEVDAPGISPENMSVVNTPTAGQILQYVNDTNFEWIDPPTGGGSIDAKFIANVIGFTPGQSGAWTVPAGVTSVSVFVVGANSGGGLNDGNIGNGASGTSGTVAFSYAVTVEPGDVFDYSVGSAGSSPRLNTLSGSSTIGRGGSSTFVARGSNSGNSTLNMLGGGQSSNGVVNHQGGGSSPPSIPASGGLTGNDTAGSNTYENIWVDFFDAADFAIQPVLGQFKSQSGHNSATWSLSSSGSPGVVGGRVSFNNTPRNGNGGGIILLY